MSCDVSEIDLQELLDGELSEERARALEAHTRECDRCTRFLDEERALAARVAALPRTIAPRPHVWRAIEATIGERRSPARRARWNVAVGAVALAAAAAVAFVVSREAPSPSPTIATGAPVASIPRVPIAPNETPTAEAHAGAHEEPYLAALAALENDFVAMKKTLAPSAIAAVDDNLRILDTAIETTRAALAARPDDLDLLAQLADVYQQKIHVETDINDLGRRI